jgi:prepilin-type N-terminal cleavage/methylation domain-containing protein
MKIKTRISAFGLVATQARPPAFTLLELSVVPAVLGVLAAILVPAVARTRPLNASIRCLANKKEITLAWLMYAADNNGRLPPNYNAASVGANPDIAFLLQHSTVRR